MLKVFYNSSKFLIFKLFFLQMLFYLALRGVGNCRPGHFALLLQPGSSGPLGVPLRGTPQG